MFGLFRHREVIFQLLDILLDLSGDSASSVAARRMEVRHVTTSNFEQNGKNFMSANVADNLPNLPSIVAVQPSGGIGGCPKLHRGTRAGKCYNVTPSYTGRYFLRYVEIPTSYSSKFSYDFFWYHWWKYWILLCQRWLPFFETSLKENGNLKLLLFRSSYVYVIVTTCRLQIRSESILKHVLLWKVKQK